MQQLPSVSRQALHLPVLAEKNDLNPKIQPVLNRLKQELATLYQERFAALVLYGSFARREETDASDIDVLVVLEGEVSQVDEIWRMGEVGTKLLLEFDELVSIVPTSQQEFLYPNSPLLLTIWQEGILV
ncbi:MULTISPECIES: nucleotidyltransferase domain-containing protein [Leptolyngbya]|uniref:nucleotidyltransferase domain-containing protein n=1 Tax=Leptolyngbya TaxID=47251 RepID=UPI001682B674|nr:nucleotidyltransferase domain-containing protein [Leptolyngbya sp. FACHB-1624]MBD1854272.1 nucleotidyltransferase domain-containing protein [Leptolyngbya sp. FACHB-1624]